MKNKNSCIQKSVSMCAFVTHQYNIIQYIENSEYMSVINIVSPIRLELYTFIEFYGITKPTHTRTHTHKVRKKI